jgi:TonB family protein
VTLTYLPDAIDLAFDETALPNDGRHEPVWASAPALVEFDAVVRLDPTRTDFDIKPSPPKRRFWRGPTGSLLLHLLPLLMLIGWPGIPVDLPQPIPIQLVVEQPQPPPPPQPTTPSPKPAPGLRASDDFGEVGPLNPKKGTDTAPPTQGEPQPPAAEAQPATPPVPTSEPIPPKEQVANAPLPPPAETLMPVPAPPLVIPKAMPPKEPATMRAPKPLEGAWPLPLHADQLHEAQRSARLVGPNATRDEYCAYALSLTMRHIDMLPLSLLGARHGDTSVAIRVLEDGTITSVKVAQSSGYADIDERIARMVIAVGRFPPLPQWMPGQWMDFTFHLHFPHPDQR